MTTELPPLPEPEICAIGSLDLREDVFAYSSDQLRAYAAAAVAAARERIDELLRTHEGMSLGTLEYLQKMREGPTPEEWAELDRNARA